MPVTETIVDAPGDWPPLAELLAAAADDALVILPEQIRTVDGVRTAFFRADAQALRLLAEETGTRAVLAGADDCALAGYTEFSDFRVLPVLLAAVIFIPGNIVADLITHEILGDPSEHVQPPTVRYREAIVVDGDLKVRVIEGPAEEVQRILRDREPAMPLPTLTEEPPPGFEP